MPSGKANWLKTLALSGLTAGAAKLAESSFTRTGVEVEPAVASAIVVAEIVREFLVHLAHSQREAHHHAKQREELAARNHHLRRGMAAALRRGLNQARTQVVNLPAEPYHAMFNSWEYVLQLAEAGKTADVESFFPAEFTESLWEATNTYAQDPEEDARALAGLLRELLDRDAIHKRWAEEQALDFARQVLPYYRQAFADDLAGDSNGLLFQAFAVKGINQIRFLVERSIHENRAGFTAIRSDIADLQAALANPRIALVKERWIGLPNTHDQILARDREAQTLLMALSTDGPAVVSIAAPPGFGKSAVFALAVRKAFSGGDPPEATLSGIAVLDARVEPPGVVPFANCLGRITGWHEAAAKFASATNGQPDASQRSLFFDFLHHSRNVWLVVENAEAALALPASSSALDGFREVLKDWCSRDHQAKLLLLTREPLYPEPRCHRRLKDVEEAILGGLPLDDAITVLRQRLGDTRFHSAERPLLEEIARRLHCVPMALEQFAGYLKANEAGMDLDWQFIEHNDLIRLFEPAQIENGLLRMIGEHLLLLDQSSLAILRVVAWAGVALPRAALSELSAESGPILTHLVRSGLLLAREGTKAEGLSFDMHPLVSEAVTDVCGAPMDLVKILKVLIEAADAESEKHQYRPALALYTLGERCARQLVEHDGHPEFANYLAHAVIGRGDALGGLGRLEEAIVAYDEGKQIHASLLDQAGRSGLANLAGALMNKAVILDDLGRLVAAVAVYDEAIVLYRELVEKDGLSQFANSLARALGNKSVSLRSLGQLDGALTAVDEALHLLRLVIQKDRSSDLREDLSVALGNSGVTLWTLGRPHEALGAYDETINLLRHLVERDGRRELADTLARTFMNKGVALQTLGRLEDALVAFEETIAIRRQLVEKDGRDELAKGLAMALMNKGLALRNLGKLSEAISANEEAVDIYRSLVNQDGRKDLANDLARALHNLALAYDGGGCPQLAISAAREARKIREELMAMGWDHIAEELAQTRAFEAWLDRVLPIS